MKAILHYIQKLWASHDFRKRLLFTLLAFAIFRLLAHIPAPGIDAQVVKSLFADTQYLSLLNLLSGGTLANASLVALGISPYITASIIMQLAALVFPSLKELQKDGESGKQRVNQYTRLLSVPLAVVQSVSVIALFRGSILTTNDPLALVTLVLSLVAGAMVVLWIGELVTEYGIGNGISMLLLGGIVSQVPQGFYTVQALIQEGLYSTIAVFGVLFLLIITLIVFMNEAIRKVPIQYAKRVRGSHLYGGQGTHLPIRVNVAGVMPIIFAVSIMVVPSLIARIFQYTESVALIDWAQWINITFALNSPVYLITYFLIVFSFTFFSAMLFFNTEDISDELKKSGAFVPGIRPGSATKKLLDFIVSRITLAGALFLGAIAILPSLAELYFSLPSLAIGGTSVLIVVSVILETAKQVESLLIEQDYNRFM